MVNRKKLTKVIDGKRYIKYDGDDFWMEAN